MADHSRAKMRLPLRLGGVLGFIGGFLLSYQRSSCKSFTFVAKVIPLTRLVGYIVRFWGWTENKAEEERDFAELSQRARDGLPLYGESLQPEWVQGAAYRNSAFSQLKFRTSFMPTVLHSQC